MQQSVTSFSEPLVLDPTLSNDKWMLANIGRGQTPDTVFNPDIDAHLLKGGVLTFQLNETVFDSGQNSLIEDILEDARTRGKTVFNSPKIRMSSDPTIDAPVSISKTDYFQGLVTNELAFKELHLKDGSRVCGSQLAFPNGCIQPLWRSQLSNHIGACALAFDSEGVVSFAITGSASIAAANKIAPSAAGSLDTEDLNGASTLNEVVLRGLTRELIEEQGISRNDIVAAQLIGFQRYIQRGAKPEFIALMRVSGSWNSLRRPLDVGEQEFTAGHIEIDFKNMGVKGVADWALENDARLAWASKQAIWRLLQVAKTDEALNSLIFGL